MMKNYGLLVSKTTRTQDNLYLGQLVPKTTRSQDKFYSHIQNDSKFSGWPN